MATEQIIYKRRSRGMKGKMQQPSEQRQHSFSQEEHESPSPPENRKRQVPARSCTRKTITIPSKQQRTSSNEEEASKETPSHSKEPKGKTLA